jgi:DNA (cytosine-5)-methyltransferase 1
MIQNEGRIRAEDQTKKFAQRVLPQRWKEGEGPSITATSLPDDYVHFLQPRILTVREWARLQTFPDWYLFAGKRTTGGRRRAGDPGAGNWSREVPKYTQIGNAVPVWLAAAVGTHLRSFLR